MKPVRGAVVVALFLAAAEELAQTQATIVFGANSFWYSPIPADVTLHPNSANFAADLVRQVKLAAPTINMSEYSATVFVADATTPTTPVVEWDCFGRGSHDAGLAQQFSAVPIPLYAVPADGTDHEMAIYQPSTDQLWEFWNARKVSGQWQTCWGGRLQHISSSSGIFRAPYGGAATGLSYVAGQITPEELRAHEIRHVMGIALIEVEDFPIFSFPANRSDGYNRDPRYPNRVPEGLRIRLDPAVNVDALNLHPVAKTIARAAQIYGFVVWDKAGAISLRATNPKSYTARGEPDPYVALLNGMPNWAVLNGFPWDKLQFLPMNYGKLLRPHAVRP